MTSLGALLARCSFAGGRTALAVSGGADSLALLVLATAAGCEATAIHVDHGLRAGSAAEAEVVGAAAERYGAEFRSLRVDVEPGPNLEARAWAARYAVLPPDVLTGHTLDDQTETVLLNLLRGAGVEGLAGMRADARRPLLALRRAETRALCEAEGLKWVEDPSNFDLAFRRNRVRHELLPLLDDIAGRDVAPILARQAGGFGEIADLLGLLASQLDVTDAVAMRAAHPVLAATAVRTWLRPVNDGHPPDAAAVARVLAVASGEIRATEVGGGWRVERSRNRLRLVQGRGGKPG
jgi:tRNA(Ile)-lysidine synthase